MGEVGVGLLLRSEGLRLTTLPLGDWLGMQPDAILYSSLGVVLALNLIRFEMKMSKGFY